MNQLEWVSSSTDGDSILRDINIILSRDRGKVPEVSRKNFDHGQVRYRIKHNGIGNYRDELTNIVNPIRMRRLELSMPTSELRSYNDDNITQIIAAYLFRRYQTKFNIVIERYNTMFLYIPVYENGEYMWVRDDEMVDILSEISPGALTKMILVTSFDIPDSMNARMLPLHNFYEFGGVTVVRRNDNDDEGEINDSIELMRHEAEHYEYIKYNYNYNNIVQIIARAFGFDIGNGFIRIENIDQSDKNEWLNLAIDNFLANHPIIMSYSPNWNDIVDYNIRLYMLYLSYASAVQDNPYLASFVELCSVESDGIISYPAWSIDDMVRVQDSLYDNITTIDRSGIHIKSNLVESDIINYRYDYEKKPVFIPNYEGTMYTMISMGRIVPQSDMIVDNRILHDNSYYNVDRVLDNPDSYPDNSMFLARNYHLAILGFFPLGKYPGLFGDSIDVSVTLKSELYTAPLHNSDDVYITAPDGYIIGIVNIEQYDRIEEEIQIKWKEGYYLSFLGKYLYYRYGIYINASYRNDRTIK